jgi:hypothetical protein
MIKRFEFNERTIYLIRKCLEDKMPKEGTLDEMILKRDEILNQFMRKEDK